MTVDRSQKSSTRVSVARALVTQPPRPSPDVGAVKATSLASTARLPGRRERLRLALVAEAPLVLAGLRASLGHRDDCEVVVSSSSLAALNAALHARSSLGVGIQDDLPLNASIDVTIIDAGVLSRGAHLSASAVAAACVLLADVQDAALAGWLRDGISVLPRTATELQIVAAAYAAAAGLVAVPPRWLSAHGAPLPRSADADGALIEPLSRREREVLSRMAGGLGNREIARELAISQHTAKFHVAQILGKLQAVSRTQAVVKGLRYGIIGVETARGDTALVD